MFWEEKNYFHLFTAFVLCYCYYNYNSSVLCKPVSSRRDKCVGWGASPAKGAVEVVLVAFLWSKSGRKKGRKKTKKTMNHLLHALGSHRRAPLGQQISRNREIAFVVKIKSKHNFVTYLPLETSSNFRSRCGSQFPVERNVFSAHNTACLHEPECIMQKCKRFAVSHRVNNYDVFKENCLFIILRARFYSLFPINYLACLNVSRASFRAWPLNIASDRYCERQGAPDTNSIGWRPNGTTSSSSVNLP